MNRSTLWEGIRHIWTVVFTVVLVAWMLFVAWWALGKAWQHARDNFPVQIHVTIVPGGR